MWWERVVAFDSWDDGDDRAVARQALQCMSSDSGKRRKMASSHSMRLNSTTILFSPLRDMRAFRTAHAVTTVSMR